MIIASLKQQERTNNQMNERDDIKLLPIIWNQISVVQGTHLIFPFVEQT